MLVRGVQGMVVLLYLMVPCGFSNPNNRTSLWNSKLRGIILPKRMVHIDQTCQVTPPLEFATGSSSKLARKQWCPQYGVPMRVQYSIYISTNNFGLSPYIPAKWKYHLWCEWQPQSWEMKGLGPVWEHICHEVLVLSGTVPRMVLKNGKQD